MLFQCYSTGYSRREGHGEDPPAGGAATQRQGEAARRGETTSRCGRDEQRRCFSNGEWKNHGQIQGNPMENP